MQEIVSEEQLQNLLVEMVDEQGFGSDPAFPELADARVDTFEEAGVMTMNKGIVISLPTGAQFQLTIVQSR